MAEVLNQLMTWLGLSGFYPTNFSELIYWFTCVTFACAFFFGIIKLMLTIPLKLSKQF